MESLLGSDVAAKKPKGGLYTLQFSYVPAADEFEELRALYEQRTRAVRAIRLRVAGSNGSKISSMVDGNVPDMDDEDIRGHPLPPGGSEDAASATKSARERFMERVAHELCAEGEDTVPGDVEDESARKRKKVEKSHPSPVATAAKSPVLDGSEPPHLSAAGGGDNNNDAATALSGPEELEKAELALREVQDEWSKMESRCATEFHPWTLLCRLRFEGDSMGRIKGSVKVKQPLSSSTATSPSAASNSKHVDPAAASSSSVGSRDRKSVV